MLNNTLHFLSLYCTVIGDYCTFLAIINSWSVNSIYSVKRRMLKNTNINNNLHKDY